MPTLKTDDGVKLHYEEAGSGTPIVFVHEFAGDWRSWEPQMRYFSRSYRCIAYNARGYPPSDVPEDVERYSQERARDDIRSVLDGLKIDQGARRRAVDGRVRDAAFRHAVSPGRAALSLTVAGGGYGAHPAQYAEFQASGARQRRGHPREGHGAFRRHLRPRRDARPVPEQGSARLRRVHPAARRAFGARARPTPCGLPGAPAVALRPDRRRCSASTCRR